MDWGHGGTWLYLLSLQTLRYGFLLLDRGHQHSLVHAEWHCTQSNNLSDLAQEGLIDNLLHQYLSNYGTVLSCHDYKLLNWFTAEGMELIPLRTKWQWICHLDTALEAFNVEKKTWESGQQVLTCYLTFRDWPPTHSFALDIKSYRTSTGTW